MRFFLLILVISLSGCYSTSHFNYSAVKEAALNINVNDGVDALEAVTLAQNFLYSKSLQRRLYSLKPIRVRLKKVGDQAGRHAYIVDPLSDTATYLGKKCWEVQFRDKEGSQLFGFYPVMPFFVNVNFESGEIDAWGILREHN